MVERRGYLTSEEEALLARRSEFVVADAIHNLGALSLALSTGMDQTVERVRAADPALIKALGKMAHALLKRVDELPVFVVTDPVVVTEPSETFVEQEAFPVLVEVAAVAEVAEVVPHEKSYNEISVEGIQWLEKGLGSGWASRLGVPIDAPREVVAEALLLLVPSVRKPNTSERIISRFMWCLSRGDGLATQPLMPDDNPTAAYQYVRQFMLRSAVDTQVSTAPERDKPDELDDLLAAPAVKSVEEAERPHVEISARIASKLQLTGAQKQGLLNFLDLKARGDMTQPKIEAVKLVREDIRNKLEDPGYGLSSVEKRYLRESLGIYVFQGHPQERTPIPLSELTGPSWSMQKRAVPGHVYSGLDKLFSGTLENRVSIDSLTQAAIELDSMTDEEFHAQRDALFADMSRDGILTEAQSVALNRRSQFGENNEHMDASADLREAVRTIERHVIELSGVNSGSELIDQALKKFISPVTISSHLNALREQLPETMKYKPQAIERIIVAGIQSVYKQAIQKTA